MFALLSLASAVGVAFFADSGCSDHVADFSFDGDGCTELNSYYDPSFKDADGNAMMAVDANGIYLSFYADDACDELAGISLGYGFTCQPLASAIEVNGHEVKYYTSSTE